MLSLESLRSASGACRATCFVKHDVALEYFLYFLSSGLLAGSSGGSKLEQMPCPLITDNTLRWTV
jgi:hypothetical protein